MKTKTVLASIALTALGFGAALLAFPHLASAWDYGSLPPGCSQGGTQYDSTGPNYAYKVLCNGVLSGWMHYGTNPYPNAPTDPTFQGNLDAFVDAHYTPPATTTTTSTTSPTTTDSTTTTTPTTTSGTTTVISTTTTTTVAPAQVPPTASFTTAPTGLVVTFTDTSTVGSAPVTKTTWLFGDGANDTGPNVSHAYTAAGSFNVVQLVTDANGLTDRSTQTITVSPFGGRKQFAEAVNASLGSAASAAFGQPLAVYCVNSWGKATPERGYGLSIVGSHQVNIWNAGCNALTQRKGNTAQALWVLAHESAHALGITSERTADCFAANRAGKLESALGIHDTGERMKIRKQVIAKWKRC